MYMCIYIYVNIVYVVAEAEGAECAREPLVPLLVVGEVREHLIKQKLSVT